MRLRTSPLVVAVAVASLLLAGRGAAAAEPPFDRPNLVAWCIVPYDGKHRGPEDRAAMLEALGFRRFAYDWRAEHLPGFDAEIEALRKHHVELSAVWFPAALDRDARRILDALERNKIQTQLWVTMGDPAPGGDPAAKLKAAVDRLGPIADAAGRIGCRVSLYNHGDWFGEPENELAILQALGRPNVGIVFNLHHGHAFLDRLPGVLAKLKPHLDAVNLNGMARDGEATGQKILQLGQGDNDLAVLRAIRDSGYRGPIGILGHTDDDAEARLRDNLDGLDWLTPQLEGKPAGPKPKPRTPVPAPRAAGAEPVPGGWLVAGRHEYRRPPLAATVRARLDRADGFNILVASDPKSSGDHWELFTWPGTGALTAYLPGRDPDHVRSDARCADGRPHEFGIDLEPDRVRLRVDGKVVADQPTASRGLPGRPGDLAFGRLAEGGIGCAGAVESARIEAGGKVVGDWQLPEPKPGTPPAADRSPLGNPARPAAPKAANGAVAPPDGIALEPADPRLRVRRIDRSQHDAYMAVKVDGAGCVFVGGRAAVYAFEPDGAGGYGLRREILRFPDPSVIIGLEFRGDDLYVLTANALYLVPGGRVAREGLAPRRLVWGVPLDYHVSFHCLAWGLDGDLYLDHGDPLLNYGERDRPDHWGHWTLYSQPEGTATPYTGVGAVLKVHPDGTGLKVVAGGLRGPVGLAFDRAGELFTNDNDHESRADLYAPARLIHVTPGADFAWPRGWMASMSPDRADLLEPVTDAMGRAVPCDLATLDEPDGAGAIAGPGLLLCRWDRMAVHHVAVEPRGASFRGAERPFLRGRDDVRPTGVAVGPGGRVFVTSLYLSGNVVTPDCPSNLVVVDGPGTPLPPGRDVAAMGSEELLGELASASTTRRWRAHGEILRRGGALLTRAADRLASGPTPDPIRTHLIWLAAAAARPEDGRALVALLADPDPAARLQAVRALAAQPKLGLPADRLAAALDDADPRVRLAALAVASDAPAAPPLAPAVAMARSDDTYLRQAATRVLARWASADALRSLQAEPSTRLAAVLAAGHRLTVIPAGDRPPAEVPLFLPADNPFFHAKLRFAGGLPDVDLRAGGRVGSYTTAQRWRAVPPTADQKALVDLLLASLADPDRRVGTQAAYSLGLLRDPAVEPRLAGARRARAARDLADAPIRDAAVIPDPENGVRFQLDSPARGPALVLIEPVPDRINIQHDGVTLADFDSAGGVIALDLHPGVNVVRYRTGAPVAVGGRIRFRAPPGVVSARPQTDRVAVSASPGGLATLAGVDWLAAAKQGRADRGQALFKSLGCAQCHAAKAGEPGGGGPSLADARGRLTVPYLAESIVEPDRQVAEPFRATAIATADGRVRTGLVVAESADRVELLLPDATRESIPRVQIDERNALKQSPMPSGLVRSADDLGDLLAFLLGGTPPP